MDYTRNEDKLGCRSLGRDNHLHSIEKVEVGTTEPVTLEQVKEHLRITFNDDDNYLTALIKSCRMHIENYCALSLVPTDITVIVDNNEGFELPYGPVVDVAAVDEVVEDDMVVTPAVDAIVPVVTANGEAIEVSFIGSVFRRLVTNGAGLTITYRAGYVVCPADLKLAILHTIAYAYENRGDGEVTIPPIAKTFAKMHRRVPKVL